MTKFLVLAVLSAVLASAAASPSCGCKKECADPNEEYVTAYFGEATCDGQKPLSCAPVTECRCRQGYVRNEGKCIRPCECPSKCSDPNEDWVFSSLTDPTCDEPAGRSCTAEYACRCREGFVRSGTKCIRPCECPSKCKDPNEDYIWTAYEDESCDDSPPRSIKPTLACRCRKGYVREGGVCIKACDCPPKCKDPNEVYVFTRYGDATCDDDAPQACEPVKACRCRAGYVRDSAGKCIKSTDCPPKCKDPNEVYVFTRFGDRTCDEDAPVACEPVKACRCKDGYVRDQGKCIRACDCPAKCTGANEVYVFTRFGDATCDKDAPEACEPVKACRCKSGYVRDAAGVCIKSCNCPPKCTGANEIWIFTRYGDATCDDDAPKTCEPVSACRCKPGYVRDADNKCIKSCQCPEKCPNPNEEYVFTRFGDATCDNAAPVACEATKACRCVAGYVRDAAGKCIKPCQCPDKCTGQNEEYVFTRLGDATCDEPAPVACEPTRACRCKAGYVRDAAGKCIKPCNCPSKCTGQNEEYVFTRYGDATCDEDAPKACEPTKACRCVTGYVRDASGKCILPCQCPDKCTLPFEEYVFTRFGDATCDDPAPVACEPVKACRCQKGYVRFEGKCIPPCKCPPKCNDPNEEFVFTRLGDATCSAAPPKSCEPVRACRCKYGYVRDDSGKCIKKCDCPCP